MLVSLSLSLGLKGPSIFRLVPVVRFCSIGLEMCRSARVEEEKKTKHLPYKNILHCCIVFSYHKAGWLVLSARPEAVGPADTPAVVTCFSSGIVGNWEVCIFDPRVPRSTSGALGARRNLLNSPGAPRLPRAPLGALRTLVISALDPRDPPGALGTPEGSFLTFKNIGIRPPWSARGMNGDMALGTTVNF